MTQGAMGQGQSDGHRGTPGRAPGRQQKGHAKAQGAQEVIDTNGR